MFYMQGIRILQIDAFTDRPFAGNRAAVWVRVQTRASTVYVP